jgi:hypothetical protein
MQTTLMLSSNNPLVSLYEKSDIGNKGGILSVEYEPEILKGLVTVKTESHCVKRGLG